MPRASGCAIASSNWRGNMAARRFAKRRIASDIQAYGQSSHRVRITARTDAIAHRRVAVSAPASTKLEEQATVKPHEKQQAYSMGTHSAIFVEARVDEALGTVRVTRVVSAGCGGAHRQSERPRQARWRAAWCGASAWRCMKKGSSIMT